MIGPIEITGFEGPITIASALSIAARTSGVGVASAIPSISTAPIGGSARSATRYSWIPRQPLAVLTRVRARCSHIRRTAASTQPPGASPVGSGHAKPLNGATRPAARNL